MKVSTVKDSDLIIIDALIVELFDFRKDKIGLLIGVHGRHQHGQVLMGA